MERAFDGASGLAASEALAAANVNPRRVILAADAKGEGRGNADKVPPGAPPAPPTLPGVEPTVRRAFADTAFWDASLTTDKNGVAEVSLTMPRAAGERQPSRT